MTTTAPTSPLSLAYQAEIVEEHLPSGALRISVAVERKQVLKAFGMIACMTIVASAGLGALWYFTGLVKAGIFAVMLGPTGLVIWVGALLTLSSGPATRTHVVEVNSQELTISTFIAGDPVTRRHSPSELHAVRVESSGLNIHTTRDSYSCLLYAKPEYLQLIRQRIHEKMGI